MWKKIIPFILCANFISCRSSLFRESSQTKNNPSAYGLLGDGFGIVTPQDIAMNGCHVKPVPFSENSTTYQYWQCFNLKQATLFCDDTSYNEDEGIYQTYVVVSGTRDGAKHEYIVNRPLTLSACDNYKKTWEQLTREEPHVCVSGSLIDVEHRKKNEKIFSWVFDRFKTRKGCYSYFKDGCSFKEQIDHPGCEQQ